MNLKTELGRLRLIALLEGISLLVILFVTMPLKYMFDYPDANKVIGMVHGLLFVVYVFAIIQAKISFGWNMKTWFLAFIVSFIPFGTFWADKKLFIPNAN